MAQLLRPRSPGGFHDGELAVQRQAGVTRAAARLEGMLAPAELSAGVARFLAGQTLMAITARDRLGRLWVSSVTGPPGFVQVTSPTTVSVHADLHPADPLRGLESPQPVGLLALDYTRRRRVRLNGTLESVSAGDLSVRIDEAFGNCPQYIPQRNEERPDPADTHTGGDLGSQALPSTSLTDDDRAAIAHADTFILGTTHPVRGNDASHRGGPAGFVRTDGDTIWWPDYPGNNLFNSLGNLRVDPEAALLFRGGAGGTTLHVHGTAELVTTEVGAPGDDGGTGRRVVFSTRLVTRQPGP